MTLATTVYVEHEDLALVPTIRSLPDVDVGVVSTAGTDPENEVHVFWVEARDFETFERRLGRDPTVDSFAVIATGEDRRTYRIEYSERAILVTPAVSEAGGLVLDSCSRENGWVLELELQDHNALDELAAFVERVGVRFDVLELRQSENVEADAQFSLTDAQMEALVTAYVHGYYDEPREISLEGLSNRLGISKTAVSGRLRRGSARLVEDVLVEEE